MEGRFQKVNITNKQFISSSGIYCNNDNVELISQIMKEQFGNPNGVHLLENTSTWKYIFKYQSNYLTVYDYNNHWSIGFLELQDQIPDYKFVKAIGSMLLNYLNSLLEQKLSQKLKVTV